MLLRPLRTHTTRWEVHLQCSNWKPRIWVGEGDCAVLVVVEKSSALWDRTWWWWRWWVGEVKILTWGILPVLFTSISSCHKKAFQHHLQVFAFSHGAKTGPGMAGVQYRRSTPTTYSLLFVPYLFDMNRGIWSVSGYWFSTSDFRKRCHWAQRPDSFSSPSRTGRAIICSETGEFPQDHDKSKTPVTM